MCWCNVAGIQHPVQKTAALPTSSRAGSRRDPWISLVSFTRLHLLNCSSLLRGQLTRCHLQDVSVTSSSSPGHPQPPNTARGPQCSPMHPERLSSMRATGAAPSQQQLLSLPSPVAAGTRGSKAEEGRSPKQCIPAFPRGEQGSPLQHPAGASPHIGHHPRPTVVPHI